MTRPIRSLAIEALADDSQATKGPWTCFPEQQRRGFRGPCLIQRGVVLHEGPAIAKMLSMLSNGRERAPYDGMWIARARTREPALARWALRALDVVEAARLLVNRHTEGRGCSFKLDPLNCGSSERLIEAVRALDAQADKESPDAP